MNPRDMLNFLRSPTGAFVAFCALLLTGLFVAHHFKKPGPDKSISLVDSAAGAQASPQLVESVGKDMTPFRPANPEPISPPPNYVAHQQQAKPELPPISLFGDAPTQEPKPLSKFYAPFGRLIPCELVITVDSSTIRTPIIGLITDDIYHAGHLIIPAGTEVHGMAQVDRVRDRIASGNNWTLVWQTGLELSITGVALNRETDPDQTGWGITDGSAGLTGRMIKTDNLAEIKLFAAAFLSGAANLLAQREQTFVGSVGVPSVGNAGLEGAQTVVGTYAQQILQTIQRDGFYVRVPAGKQFYLYVTQDIDRTDAAVGESRSHTNEPDGPIPGRQALAAEGQPPPLPPVQIQKP
jgi:Bacterial conjugation TrbI-like protein